MRVRISTLITWATLLVLGQLLITQWTVNAAGNRDVIDYVSFAGTVVGMILAVLAIVYSYLANASQKSDSEALRNQVSNLNDAINRAAASGNQFANEVERLEEVRQSIAIAVANSAASLKATQELRDDLVTARAETEKPVEKQPTEAKQLPSSSSEIGAIELLAKRALPRQVIYYYLAAHFRSMPDDKHNELMRELVYSAISEKTRATFSLLYEGEMWGYYWVLYDFSAISKEPNFLLFLKLLLKRIENLSSASFGNMNADEEKELKGRLSKVEALIRSDVAGIS